MAETKKGKKSESGGCVWAQFLAGGEGKGFGSRRHGVKISVLTLNSCVAGAWLLSLSELQSAQPTSGDNTVDFIGIKSDSVSKCFALCLASADTEWPFFPPVITEGLWLWPFSGPQSNVSRNRDLLLLWASSGPQRAGNAWRAASSLTLVVGGGGGGGSGGGLPVREAVRVRAGHWLTCRLLCASSYRICFLKGLNELLE